MDDRARAAAEPLAEATLADRFDLDKSRVLLNGAQAIVRLLLSQKARDRRAGLNTGGFVSGYRGSPLGGLDLQFHKIAALFAANDIHFEPGLNEELAATAIWGAQQAELRGEGRFDGVFGLWYGKGPGVDRSGDAFRHANLAGTSRCGGVLALMGDDATAESSTTAHQSEFAFVDAMMPILAPAGVQEILDYGALGWGLSRYAGVWVGLKCVKDTVEFDGRGRRFARSRRAGRADGFSAAARRPRHPPRRRRAGAGRAPARAQAACGRRLARRQPARSPDHDRRRGDGDQNLAAFDWGRALAADPSALAAFMRPAPAQSDDSLEALRERRAAFLTDYQDRAYAERYRADVAMAAKAERERAPGADAFARAVARGLFKLMAYKDEYEVARLYSDGAFAAELKDAFDGDLKLTFYLAPSWLARGDGRGGEPKKIVYGAWMMTALRVLARLRRLRGTRFDPFGYSRRAARRAGDDRRLRSAGR